MPDPVEVQKALRLKMLTTIPAEIGVTPTAEFPRVYAVVIDWPVGEIIASVVSVCDGNASLYTTSTFGIIGGIGHEPVRAAAQTLVKTAAPYFDEAIPTTDYSHAVPSRVKFFLLSFSGNRVIDADYASICTRKDRYSHLFGCGQAVVTQLRLISEKKPE